MSNKPQGLSYLIEELRKAGSESINGTAPYGEKWIDGELVTCQEETETLNIMIEMRKQGHTYHFISCTLSTQGRFNRSGLGWTASNVFLVLKANNAT
tara:strand:- start:2710 stop:3000 length:291 start_codon:yes stop_codon:yes gene_type:complete